VQLAGAIGARHPRKRVSLIDGETTLLATMADATGRDAMRILGDRDVRMYLGSEVDEIEESAVTVGGERIDGLVVWAAGFTPRADRFGLPLTESGRIDVGDDLRIRGWRSTFAAGDIAAHTDASGTELPMSAQIAVQAGDIAGANAAGVLRGDTPRAADLAHRGWVLDLGGCRGLAEIGPVTLTAPFLDLVPPILHWGIDVRHLVETRGFAGLGDRPR
jgi:NADH dehydrogenase